jgi:uroporphyrin-III C-methyltransferase/precorrin-2 dehydrogenase/sirohydrochlorin ferrochelatase
VQNDISYEVVPGITAAAGCSMYAGFPLTHRDFSQSVVLIAGHQQAGTDSVDYARLANSGDTIVFYMGIKNAHEIQQSLLENGMNSDTPVAVIENGTMANQRETICTLGSFVETIAKQQVQPPALIIVGEVIKVRERLIPNKSKNHE